MSLTVPESREFPEVVRVRACEHGTPHRVTSSMSRVWCGECGDTVRVNFYPVPERYV